LPNFLATICGWIVNPNAGYSGIADHQITTVLTDYSVTVGDVCFDCVRSDKKVMFSPVSVCLSVNMIIQKLLIVLFEIL